MKDKLFFQSQKTSGERPTPQTLISKQAAVETPLSREETARRAALLYAAPERPERRRLDYWREAEALVMKACKTAAPASD